MKDKKSNKNQKAKAIAVISLMILAVVCALIFGLKGCSNNPDNIVTSTSGFVLDENAQEGGWNETDAQKIKDGLNASVEEGYINISMNTTPVFENGLSEGNLMIVNEKVNRYPQRVVITRNDTNEVIYESKGILVGSKIEKAKLSENLPSGTYECTAMFHNVDPETGDSLGCAGAVIYITIKN